MKLKRLLFIGVPPIVIVGVLAYVEEITLAEMNWPMLAVLGCLIGVFTAFAYHLFEKEK